MSFSQLELDARNTAVAEYRKRFRTTPANDEKLCAPYMTMTRHQHSLFVSRERMRYEAEHIRKHKDRATEAKNAWLAAKAGLAARDRLHGKPS